MTHGRSGTARTAWQHDVLAWAGRVLLLVPEAPLIASLVCAYLALGKPVAIGLLVALLALGLIVRTVALHVARASLDAARYRQAEAFIQVALTIYPWSADALAMRGTLALATGAPDAAETALRRAIALLPGQSSFHAALAGALLEQNRPVEAIQAARQALALDERNAVAYMYLAEAERANGAASHVVEDLLRAGLKVATIPAAEAALRCALAGQLLAEHRVAEATLTIHGAEALLPRCSALCQVGLRFRLSELLIAQNQIDRAYEHIRGAEDLSPHGRFSVAFRPDRLLSDQAAER